MVLVATKEIPIEVEGQGPAPDPTMAILKFLCLRRKECPSPPCGDCGCREKDAESTCVYRLLSRGEPGLEQPLSAGLIPAAQGAAGGEERDSICRCAMGGGEWNGSSSCIGEVKKAPDPCDAGPCPPLKVPVDAEKRTHRRLACKWHQLCSMRVPVPVLVLVVLVAVLVALAVAVAVAVVSAGRPEGSLAPVPDCAHEWVGHRGVCYYLSSEEGSWEWSRERCSCLGASLAVLKEPWEREFLLHLKGNIDYWVGLRRRGRELEWVDGSSFNHSFPVQGGESCVYLSDHAVVSGSCSQARQYLCSKPQFLE